MPYLGRGLSFGFGAESTWGTAVSRTNWVRGISESMKRTVNKRPRPHLAHATGSRTTSSHYVESDNSGGSLEMEMYYEGMGLLLKNILGGTPSTTGAGPYTHAYALGANLPTGLTCEVIRGNGTAEVFEGCLISKVTFKVSAGGIMTLSLDLIAETSGGRVSAGTATYTSNDVPVLHMQAGTFSFNSVSYTLEGFELVIDNKIATRQVLGSILTAAPSPSDNCEITCKVDLSWSADTLNTALTADTQGDTNLVFTGPSSRSMTFALHNAYLTDVSDPVSGVGVVKQSATFHAESDGTDEGVKITIVNTQSSATAA